MTTIDLEPGTRSSTPRVVLVDDSHEIRALVGLALERHGDFIVIGQAGDGAVGVEVAAEHQPDLVLLDVNMPVMDGLTALPLIRAAAPGTLVVLLTAAASPSVRRQAHELGAVAVIPKGSPARHLVDELTDVLAEHRTS